MLDILYNTFLFTTDPETQYSELLSKDVLFSIVIHLALYLIAYLLLVGLFDLPNKPLLFAGGLLIIMILGFVGRLARTKGIYQVFLQRGESRISARQIAMKVTRDAYFTWYFLS
jgi:hypothetical protein